MRYLPLKLHLSAPSVLIMCWSEFPRDIFLVHSYLIYIYISLFLDDDNVANYADSTTPYAMEENTLQVLKEIEDKAGCVLIGFQLIILKQAQRNLFFSY